MVSAVKIAAKIVVPATKNMRVWRLVMLTSNVGTRPTAGLSDARSKESNADVREVADPNPAGIQRREHDDRQHDDAQQPFETRSAGNSGMSRQHIASAEVRGCERSEVYTGIPWHSIGIDPTSWVGSTDPPTLVATRSIRAHFRAEG